MAAAKRIPRSACPHTGTITTTQTTTAKCARCDVTEHLRLCTSCGEVFCCESDNAHNREHYEATKHPIIVPAPTGSPYTFTWCWTCHAYLT